MCATPQWSSGAAAANPVPKEHTMTTERMREIIDMACRLQTAPEPQQFVYPAAVAQNHVTHEATWNQFDKNWPDRAPCYCIECCEKVTHREWYCIPGITSAPHDKSFLDMQFGLDHAKRLTAKQYCDAMMAWCRNTDPTQSKRLWAAFHETEARVQ